MCAVALNLKLELEALRAAQVRDLHLLETPIARVCTREPWGNVAAVATPNARRLVLTTDVVPPPLGWGQAFSSRHVEHLQRSLRPARAGP